MPDPEQQPVAKPSDSRSIAEHIAKVDPATVTDTLIVAFGNDTGQEPIDFIRLAPSYVAVLLKEVREEQAKNLILTQRLEANIRTITEFNLALAEYGTQVNDPLILQNIGLCIEQVKQRIENQQKQGGPATLTPDEMAKVFALGNGPVHQTPAHQQN